MGGLPRPPYPNLCIRREPVEAVTDREAARQIAADIIARFEKQSRWKPIKAQARKALALAEYYARENLPLPTPALKALGHCLGVYAYADRRDRASRAAQCEGRALAEGKTITVEYLAKRYKVSTRTVHYWRKSEGYRRRREYVREFFAALYARRDIPLKEFLALPEAFISDYPREALDLPNTCSAAIIQAVRRAGASAVPREARRRAFDLISVCTCLQIAPTPKYLDALAAALGLAEVNTVVPYVGKE